MRRLLVLLALMLAGCGSATPVVSLHATATLPPQNAQPPPPTPQLPPTPSPPFTSHLPLGPQQAPRRPTLFASLQVVEAAWRHSPFRSGHGYCATGGTSSSQAVGAGDECDYVAGNIQVSVAYEQGFAWRFRLPAYDPSVGLGNRTPASRRYWSFLLSLLPQGSRQGTCGTVSPSIQGGPAKVCLYHYKYRFTVAGGGHGIGDTLVVAHYLRPRAGGDAGVIVPDDLHMGLDSVHA